MINALKTLAGLGLLAGVIWFVAYFSMAGRQSPDEATLLGTLQPGRTVGPIELALGTPQVSFFGSDQAGLNAWLASYPELQTAVKNNLSGHNSIRVYTWDAGYAQALVLFYGMTYTSDNVSMPLTGYAYQTRSPLKVASRFDLPGR